MKQKIKDYYINKKYDNIKIKNKKMYNYFIEKTDSYLPILIMGAGSNTYPMALLKSGFDIRVIDFDAKRIEEYANKIQDEENYYYKNMEFDKIDKNFESGSFSGIWIDDALLFCNIDEVENILLKLFELLDDEGYIKINFIVGIRPLKIFDTNFEPTTKFKITKLLNTINRKNLDIVNKDAIIEPMMKQLKDIKIFELVKYTEEINIDKFDFPVNIASTIIRKK